MPASDHTEKEGLNQESSMHKKVVASDEGQLAKLLLVTVDGLLRNCGLFVRHLHAFVEAA